MGEWVWGVGGGGREEGEGAVPQQAATHYTRQYVKTKQLVGANMWVRTAKFDTSGKQKNLGSIPLRFSLVILPKVQMAGCMHPTSVAWSEVTL